jgi:acylphosphatase
MQITRQLRLNGRVQGVFFRESMCREAARQGVSGWVRNRRDGSLEAMLQGEAAQVEALIAWARRGPPAAQVENMEISEGNGEFSGFERLPNA